MMIISSKDTVNQQLAGGWDETTTGVAVKRFKRSTSPDDALRKELERARSEWESGKCITKHSSDVLLRLPKIHGKNLDNPKKQSHPGSSSAEGLASESLACARHGINYYQHIQEDDGHWAGDYGGPMFLMPGLVISCYISNTPFAEEERQEMMRYLRCHTNEDGGWGLHIEGHSTVFGTAMNYIAYRLLGASPDEATCVRARSWLHKVPGASLGIPSWGKFWLATLGLYSWDGLNVIPPELWLLPYWVPLNPGRLWCHCRVVYLPMCYIYGNRFTAPETPLIKQLRSELFVEKFSTIDWSKQRNHVAKVDLYTPHSKLLKIFNWIAYQYEKVHWGWLRRKSLAIALDHIHHEDLTTKYIDIGPVNKAINMLAVYYSGNKQAHQRHTQRIRDYLWIAEDGMKMQGYNGSQLWDTAFAAQAIFESGLALDFKACLAKVHSYLDVTQVLEDVDDNVKYYRHISKGAWPFSTVDHGWPISDCTSEGLKAALCYVENSKIDLVPKFLEQERFQFSVNYLLSMQNKDGGWATYELTRGGQLLESLNCSEVFGDIMIDYTYVECTSACVQALHRFALLYPDHRSQEVRSSIRRGQDMIKSVQKSDGSWYGSWAICFTYACWFGIEALALDDSSRKANKLLIDKCCDFLRSKQMSDGGWGESYESCVRKEYRDSQSGHVVCTAWALLSLILANPRASASSAVVQSVERGVRFLMNAQLPNGDWAQQSISGVFNRNCMISYSNYRNIFPIWALGRFANWK